MRVQTKKKLEAAGFRVGDTAEFLGLSAIEDALVDLKLALAGTLRTVRERQRMTQAQLARRIRSSQSRVAKMEAGDASVTLDLLLKTLLAAGAKRSELGKAFTSRRRAS